MQTSRIIIENGYLISPINVSSICDEILVGCAIDFPGVESYSTTKLFDESGATAEGRYFGIGVVLSNPYRVILGDPWASTNLTEYRLADEPTEDSVKRFDDIKKGIVAALRLKPGRRRTQNGENWLLGFDTAMSWRKSNAER